MDNVTNHQSLSLLNCQSTDDILSTECNPDNNTNKTVNMNVPLINTCLSTSAVNTSFRSQQCCINPLYNQTYSGHTQYLHQTSNLSHRSQSTLSNTISSNFSSSHPKEDSTVVSPSTALSTRKIINYISLTNDQAQQIHPSVLLYNQRCGNQIPTIYEPTVTIEKMNSNYGDSNDGNTNPSYSLIYMPSSPHYLPSSRSSNYHSISAIQPIQQKDQMRIDTQRSLFSTYDINCISNNNLRSPNIIETVAKFTDSIGFGSSISNSNDDSTSLSDYDPYGEENIIDSAQQTTLQDDPASSSSTGSNNNNNNGSVNATNKRIKRKSAWIPPPLLIPDKINSFSLYDPSLSANAVISTGTSIALPSSDQANNTTLTMDEYMNRYKYINYDKSSENASFYQSRHGQHPNSPHSTDSSSVFQNTRKRSVSFAERLPLCYKYQLIDMLSLECSSNDHNHTAVESFIKSSIIIDRHQHQPCEAFRFIVNILEQRLAQDISKTWNTLHDSATKSKNNETFTHQFMDNGYNPQYPDAIDRINNPDQLLRKALIQMLNRIPHSSSSHSSDESSS